MYQGLKGSFKTVADLEPVLSILIQHGIIRPEPVQDHTGPGRKPSPPFEVHPELVAVHPHNSHNSHNPGEAFRRPHSEDCGHCGDYSDAGRIHEDRWEEGEIP
jgi:hypothetical protein